MKHFKNLLLVVVIFLAVGIAVTAFAQSGSGNDYGSRGASYGPRMGYDQGYADRAMDWLGCLAGYGPGNGRHMMGYRGSHSGRCR